MAGVKIEGMLASALEKLASQPSTLLDLVAAPADPTDAPAALTHYVEEHGGAIVRVKPDGVQLRLPVAEVRGFSESGLVSAVRMARLARMH